MKLYSKLMEIAIGIGIGIGMVIALIAGKKKRRERKQSSGVNLGTKSEQLQRADKELITVILPTIDDSK